MICRFCGSPDSWRNGHKPDGTQRYLCKNCGREYTKKTQKSSEHDPTIQATGLNSAATKSLLAGEREKHPRTGVGAVAGIEEREMGRTKQIQECDLLKAFSKEMRGKIIEFAVHKLNQGYSEVSVKTYLYSLKNLMKRGADLHDPESVKTVLAREKRWSNKTKAILVTAYDALPKYLHVEWDPPKYSYSRKIPFIPLETEIDQLIAGCSKAVSAVLQTIKETGARVGEVARINWSDVDFERNITTINDPEKNGTPRQIKVSSKLIAMIQGLRKRGRTVFPRAKMISSYYYVQRKRIAHKLNNPRLESISLHTLRHWHATMLYHKTRDILLVQKRLGHRNIQSTLLYTQLITFEGDDFHSATADTVNDVKQLVEAGFEYVCDVEGVKVFRKRK